MQLQLSTSLPFPVANDEAASGDLGIAWSGSGSVIAVAKPNHPIRLWDPLRGVILKVLQRVDPVVSGALAFSPDGSRLAAILSNGKVQMWDCQSGEACAVVSDECFGSPAIEWSIDRQCLAVARGRILEIWESYSGSPMRRVDVGYDVSALAWSRDSDMLASAGSGIIKLWKRDLIQHTNHRLFVPNRSEVITAIAWMAEQNRLFAAGASGTIYSWNIDNSEVDQTLNGHQKPVIGLALSGNGRILASKSLDQTVRFWNVRDWSSISVEEEGSKSSQLPAIAFHPSLLLLASSDCEMSVVNIRSFDLGFNAARSRPLKLFFSYSRDDDDLRKRLIRHLSPFEQNGRILCWFDQKTSPGDQWDPAIKEQIDSCDIAVCLLSAPFISSEPCRRELERIFARHKLQGLTILPIVLRPMVFERSSLADFQAGPLYKGRLKPVAEWPNVDRALAEAARWIIGKIDELSIG